MASYKELVEQKRKELGLLTTSNYATDKQQKTGSTTSKDTIGSRNAADGSSKVSYKELVEQKRKELELPKFSTSRNETETKPEEKSGLTSEQRRAALMIDLEESRRAESDAIRRFESVGDNDEGIKMLGQIASEAAERRKSIENQLKELDFEDKYSTKTYDDNFFGQAAASFTVGNLSEKSSKAWYDYLQDPSEENRWRKDMIDTALQKFQTNNEATLADDATLPWLSQSLAGYLPQLGRRIGYSAAGGAMGAAAGSAVPVIGTGLGLKAGITAGSGLYSYQTMRGAAFRELVNAGMDEETAMKASNDEAVLSAIIEMGDTAFDIATLGGGTLIKNLLSEGAEAAVKNSGKKRLLKALGGYGLNIAGEMGEEGMQEAVSIANANRGDTGILNLTGESINTLWEAAHNTDSDNWKQIWGAAKEGGKIAAMMGGAQGAVNFAANEAVTRQRGSAVNAEGDVSVQQLIEMALETEEGTESREMAEQMQTRYAAGENFSNREVGKLYNATVDSVSGGRVIRQESTEQVPQQTAEQTSDGHTELAKAAMEMAGVETEERTAVAEDYSATPNNTTEIPNNTTPVVNNASQNVRNATETTNNATAAADPIAQKAASVRKLTEEFVSLSTGYGEHGSRAVMEVMESENLTAPEARRMVETSYELGYRNQTVDTTRLNDVQMKAYEAGKLDAAAQGQRNVATAAASAVHQGGIDTSHKDSDNLYVTRLKNTQPKVYAAVDKLGKATGARIVFDKSLRGGMSNGSYISKTGEIHIAPDAQNPVMQVMRHEVTHRMKDTAPAAYNAFREEALQVMGEGAVERMKAQYLRDSDGKVRLTTEGAMDEIAALYAEKILTDDKELGNFIEKGKQNTKSRSMVQKFFDAIHNFVAKIKSMLNDDKASQDAAAMQEFGVTIDQLERAEQLWKDALAESEQNVKAKRQGIETSAQQEYNGSNETQYALKYWKPDLNKTEWSIVNSVMSGYHSGNTWDADEITVGFHVKSKGEEVFGYYSTDDDTLLYASGGENAVADNARREEIYRRYARGSNKTRRTLDRHFEDLWNQSGIGRVHSDSVENRKTTVATGELSETLSENRGRNTDKGRNNGRSGSNPENEVKQYSLKDRSGRDLSKGQQEYFKDSKVRDKNGNLQVVYHGTRKADFTVFKRNVNYFTNSKEMADSYAPSSEMFEGYLNITKPFEIDAHGEKWSSVPIDSATKKLLDQYGGSSFKERGKWRSTPADIASVIEEAVDEGDLDYDGVIIRNVDDTGSYWKKTDKIVADDFIAFNSKQFKNVGNLNPTDDPDIRFSLKSPVEETDKLIAVHNMSENKLRGSLRIGGLAMPSIAIVKAKTGHTNYGPISFVFGKDTFDPEKNSKNKVYGGDAWTPTVPSVEYQVNYEAKQAFENKVENLARKIADGMFARYSVVSSIGIDDVSRYGAEEIADKLSKDDTVRAAFLADQGKTLDPVMRDKPREFDQYGNDALQLYIERMGEDAFIDKFFDVTDENGLLDSLIAVENEDLQFVRETLKEHWRNKPRFGKPYPEQVLENRAQKINEYRAAKFVKNAWAYYVNGNLGHNEQEVDRYATSDALKQAVNDKEVKAWVLKNIDGILGESGIRNDKDPFLPSGKRRGFWQTHDKYTLENIVKAMSTGQQARGEGLWGVSAKGLQSVSTPEYKSISEIKADSGRLGRESDEVYKAKAKAIDIEIDKVVDAIIAKGNGDSFNSYDFVSDLLIRTAEGKKTVDAIVSAFRKEGYNIGNKIAKDIQALYKAAAELPTEYFEAKPRRAVGFDEVMAIILPDDTDAALQTELTDRGVNVMTYKAGDETDRLRQLNSVEGAQFSLKSKPTAPTFYSHMARVIDGVKQEKLGAASVVPMLRGKGVKQEEIKWSGIEEFLEGKKSVTKQELQEFAEGSMLDIEEVERGETKRYTEAQRKRLDELEKEEEYAMDEMWDTWTEEFEDEFPVDQFTANFVERRFRKRINKINEQTGLDITKGQERILQLAALVDRNREEVEEISMQGEGQIAKWGQYKLDGGYNYRELLFKMPDSDYSNKAMKAHWDDTNGVLAHARVQDFDTADGKMLFIEEIQSDWHNEGHKQGYGNDTASDIYDRIAAHNRKVDTDPKLYAIAGKLIPNIIENNKRFGIEISEDTARQYAGNAILSHRGDAKEFANIKGIELTSDEMVALDSFIDGKKSLDRERATAIVRKPVPDAPFRDTYHEFVMKRLLRMAAEEGYDSIGWTTADIQSKRWSDEYAEGYRIEYDQDIPKFMRKYGKKWGAKVGKTEIQTKHLTKDQEAKLYKLAEILEEGEEYIREGKGIVEVWSMPITDDMWESVLHEGQPMYSLRNQSDIVKDSADRRAVNTALRRAYKNGEIVVMDKPSLHRMTKRMMDSVGSKADVKDIEARVTELYEYIINGENGDRGEFNTAYELAYAIGVELADSAVAVEQDDYQDMKELRDVIRTTGITINKAYDHDLIGYESINEFRKANFGRIKLTKDGIPVDSFYQELATSFPGYFNESEYTTQPEQLMHIAEVLDGLKPTEYNPYEGNTAEAASWFANDLLMRIYGMQNERIADVIVRQKESAARAVKRESAKRAEAVKKVRTKYKDRDLRDRIERHAADLRHKLLRPSDKHHIPDEYRGLVLAVLDSINLESKYDYVYDADGKRTRVERATIVGAEMTKRTQAFSALKDRYAQLAEEGDMVVDPDLIGDAAYGPGKLDKIVAMGDVPIANMDSDQLQLIWDVIRSLEHGINNAGKTLSKAKYANTAAWAEAITLDTGSRRTKKGSTAERFRIDLENPLTFFSHYGEAGKAIFRMLRDAQDRQQQMVSEVKAEVQKIVDKNSVEKWERDIHTFTTDRGDNLTLSTAHIMEIYLLMKREQAQDHLLKGGIVQPEIEGILGKRKKINRGTDAVLLTFDDLAKIIKTLTKEQIQVADGLQQLTSSTLAEYGNEASMKAYGYRKFTGKDYWTIKSAQEGVHSNVEKGGNNTRSIKNIGLAKSVVPHANNPLDIGGVFKTFSSHAGDMIDYAAWLCPMEDASRLYNFKFKGTGKTMKGLLDRYGGKGAQQYWSRLMEDIQNGLSATNDSEFLAPINKVIGNVKGASVGANIRVIVQQPTAMLRAAVVLNPVNMTKGLAKGVTEGSGWQKALKYSAIAQRKDMGGFDISSPMQMNEILFDSKGKLQRFNELMMEGAAKADSLTWGRIWNACEWEIADTTELKAGTEEFYEAVAEKFTEVIDQSQVVDGVLQRSQTMRSGNAIMKQATAFMGEPTMTLNMLLRAYDAFVNTDGKERSEARKFFGRTAAVLAVTTAVNALAQSIVDGWRDDEEEEDYLERVGNAFVENLLQGLNPLGYIPIAKDAISILQGYNVTRADADVMGDIITAFKSLADSFTADGKKTVFNASWNLIKQTSKVFGVSAGNIVRDVHGIVRSIASETDSLEVEYFMERAIYKLNGKNQNRFMNILWRAYEQGDTDLYEKMVTDMIDNGIEFSTIQSGMRSRAKAAGVDASDLNDIDYLASLNLKNPTVKEEKVEFTVNDLADPLAYERDYSRIYMDIYSEFLLHGYHNLDAETQNKMLEAAYDYAHETALAKHSSGQYEISTEWILEAQQSGLDIGTYIMYNKQSTGLSKMEKLDLMDDMNLRGDEYNALLEAAFFTATDKKKLDAAALGADQYDDYTREFVEVYEDVESSLERTRSWNSYDEDAQDKMLDYAETFAREYALEQLSRGRYDSTTEFNYVTVDDVLGGIRAGLDEGEIFEAIYIKGTLPGIKDKNGNTVTNSKKDQFIAWMQKKGWSRNKQKAMLQAVGYSTRGF